MNYKSIPQSWPKNEQYFIFLNRSLRLFLLLFVSGLMLTIISGCTPALIEAAMRNDITEVESLLDEGIDINAKGPDGTTALHEAAFRGHKALMELLLARGADVNARSDKGVTPLYSACRKENTDIVNLLLEKGADVNAKTNEGAAPLYIACQEGRPEVVKILLEHDADIDDNSFKEITPLMMASCEGHQEIVHFLLEKGADVNAEGGIYTTPLFQACSSGHLEVVNILLEHGAKVNIDPVKWDTPLYIASSKGHEEIVHVLVEKGADFNAQNEHSRTALHAAAKNDHQEISDYLIRQGAKPNIVERDLNDIYATAIIYELSAKYYAEKKDREKIIEHLEPAAKYFEKASQGCKKAADKIGREIYAAESAMVYDTREAWARIFDRDRRNSPTRFRRPPAPIVKHYSRDEMIALKKKHKSLLQIYNFCNKRAVVCYQVLKCCRDAKSEADLKECLKNLEKN